MRLLCTLAICVAPAVSAGTSDMPRAAASFEKLCRERLYQMPIGYAVVLSVAGWRELDQANLDRACDDLGAPCIYEQVGVDVKTAPPATLSKLALQEKAQFCTALLNVPEGGFFNLLTHAEDTFIAFAKYRSTPACPALEQAPCEMHMLGDAPFLRRTFENPPETVELHISGTHKFLGLFTKDDPSALSRPIAYPAKLTAAHLHLPDYTYRIDRLK